MAPLYPATTLSNHSTTRFSFGGPYVHLLDSTTTRAAQRQAGNGRGRTLDLGAHPSAATLVARSLWSARSSGPLGGVGATATRRSPALDGLRAIGIVAVVAYHLSTKWLPGGYLGVDIFFVVSGFLITGILMDLLVPSPISARPALRSFWARRARRVLPALIGLLVGVSLAASLLAHDAVGRLRADIPAVIGFVANWRLLAHHNSYFESWGRPPLLLHLWSLAVEEQFYLLWPLVIVVIAKLARNPGRAITRTALVGATASAVLMGWLYVPGHDGSSLYYNTFTHASGLLIGAALCCATRHGRPASGIRASRRRARTGGAALLGLLACTATVTTSSGFAYRGGIFLASALTGVVVVTSVHPGPLERVLGAAPLRYVGARSYSLYLWHWPIICLTRPGIDVALPGPEVLALRLVLMLAATELSYRFIEQPFRTGQVQSVLRGLRSAPKTAAMASAGLCVVGALALLGLTAAAPMPRLLAAGSTAAARARLVPVAGAAAAAPGAAGISRTGTERAPAGTPTSTSVLRRATSTAPLTTAPRQARTTAPRPARSRATARPAARPTALPATAPPTAARPPTPPSTAGSPARLAHPYLAIGDSVLLAAAPALEADMHGDITIDASVGRQVAQGIARLAQYKQAGDLRGLKGLVIDLGTNGPLSPADASQLRSLAAGVPVIVFVNVRVPRPWQAETNASIAPMQAVPGVRVVDWYDASSRPGVFWADGVHPGPRGQLLYARLVSAALQSRESLP
ncbi:MAG TPA: acyltransferase family protein [Acidimicrobiales bacterium]|nr:acyltransferase family protein [Acidimicrobiales bacterium]